MVRILFVAFLLCLVMSCRSSQSNKMVDGYPLASAEDPPIGKHAEPGKSSGVFLGSYKTCDGYGNFFKSQMGFFMRYVMYNFVNMLQDLTLEKCKNSHTCQCKDNQYFTDTISGITLYRCVETADAGVELEETYKATKSFPVDGVIKFALPRSFCEKQKIDGKN